MSANTNSHHDPFAAHAHAIQSHPNGEMSEAAFRRLCLRSRGGDYEPNWRDTFVAIIPILVTIALLAWVAWRGM